MRLRDLVFLAFCIVLPIMLISIISAEETISSSTETQFSNTFTEAFCDASGRWWNEQGAEGTFDQSSSMNNCYKDVVAEGSSNNCCPIDYVCNSNKCEPESTIRDCDDYKDINACTGYVYSVAISDIAAKTKKPGYCNGYSEMYYDVNNKACTKGITNCRCFWNSTSLKCESTWNQTTRCNGELSSNGKCTFATTEKGNCTGGFRITKWTALWDPNPSNLEKPATCKEGESRVRCGSNELPGFKTISLVVAVILIILFYVLYTRKSRKNATGRKMRKKK